jgi:DNA-binding FrmR family transcriptional regulator
MEDVARRPRAHAVKNGHPIAHDPASKRAMEARLARIEGQVRAVRRMVADDRECEDIALQLAAARKALDRAFYEMISCMIRAQAPLAASARRQQAAKIGQLLSRFG